MVHPGWRVRNVQGGAREVVGGGIWRRYLEVRLWQLMAFFLVFLQDLARFTKSPSAFEALVMKIRPALAKLPPDTCGYESVVLVENVNNAQTMGNDQWSGKLMING